MAVPPFPLSDLVAELGLDAGACIPCGRDILKVPAEACPLPRTQPGRLILVSAITPTPAGEGKTTVAIGLAQALRQLGARTALALRQPSMGPVFGRKGGATGAGRSALVPADRINLHFTGDFHAVTSAHNLLTAAIDNRLHFQSTRLHARQILWKRVLDLNDRALRSVVIGCHGQGVERPTGFDITAASEIMAILCLAESIEDLRDRLDAMVVGMASDGTPVRAAEIGITGALLALLRDAMIPNLVRSVEGAPAFVHGGPFANIAHGCSSVLATRRALACADYVVTEAGFGFDLGGVKFLDIKCRQSGLAPAAIVIIATVRALKRHGGRAESDLTSPDPQALERGLENLAAHLDAAAIFQRPVIVALNQFPDDRSEELELVRTWCANRGVPCETANVVALGTAGGLALAECVRAAAERPSPPLPALYPLTAPIEEKLHVIATRICGADGVDLANAARTKLDWLRRHGLEAAAICLAKTPTSLTDRPSIIGRPRGFRLHVRDFEIAAGAQFVVALTGTLVRMPALPAHPAAERFDLAPDGTITGW